VASARNICVFLTEIHALTAIDKERLTVLMTKWSKHTVRRFLIYQVVKIFPPVLHSDGETV